MQDAAEQVSPDFGKQFSCGLATVAVLRKKQQQAAPLDSRYSEAARILCALSEQKANSLLLNAAVELCDDDKGIAIMELVHGEIGFVWWPDHVDEVLMRFIGYRTGGAVCGSIPGRLQ